MSKPEVPIVLAKTYFTGQTTPLGATTIFTPTTDDLYRLSIVVQDQPAGNNPGWTVSWADSSGAQSVNLSPTIAVNGYNSITATFYAVAGTAIQLQANFSANFSYNLYTCLEEL